MCFILPVTSLHIGLQDFKHDAFQRVFISNPAEMAIIITLMNNSCIISLDTDGPEAIERTRILHFVCSSARISEVREMSRIPRGRPSPPPPVTSSLFLDQSD